MFFYSMILTHICSANESDIENLKIVNLSSITGISSKILHNNSDYLIDNNVIYNREAYEYIFLITFWPNQSNNEIRHLKDDYILDGDSDDLNSFASELIYLNDFDAKKNTIIRVGKTGVSYAIDLILGSVEMHLTPPELINPPIVQSPIRMYNRFKELYYDSKYMLNKEYRKETDRERSKKIELEKIIKSFSSPAEAKKAVISFAEAYWFDLCSKISNGYGMDWSKIQIFKSTEFIENEAATTLGTIASIEIITLGILYLKSAKLGKLNSLLKANKIFKYTKSTRSFNRVINTGGNATTLYKTTLKKIKKSNQTKKKNSGKPRLNKKEKEIYKKAGVGEIEEVRIKGSDKPVKVKKKKIDKNRKKDGLTNCERMKKGMSPIDKDGSNIQLHHHRQQDVLTGDGYYVELSEKEHKKYGNDLKLHSKEKGSGISSEEQKKHRNFTKKYWENRANNCVDKL
jgi:hypothetical protein